MPTFKVYNAVLRLAGQVTQELAKPGITAPELMMYRALHSQDAIVRVEAAGTRTMETDELRTQIDNKFGTDKTAKVFGPHINSSLPKADADADRQAKETAALKVDLDALRATIRAEVEAEYKAGKDFLFEGRDDFCMGDDEPAPSSKPFRPLTLGTAVDGGDAAPLSAEDALADMPPRAKAVSNNVDHLLG